MFGIHDYALFVAAASVLILTPGPDTAYIVSRSIAQGRTAGVVSALGIQLGLCVHIAFTALGLTALVATSPAAFELVKISGAAYLVWIGFGLLRAEKTSAPQSTMQSDARTARTLLFQAFMSNVLNPKVIVFFISFFPQFVTPAHPGKMGAFFVLGATMLVLNMVWQLPLALAAASLTARMRASPAVSRWLARLAGIAFIAIGVKLAFTKRA